MIGQTNSAEQSRQKLLESDVAICMLRTRLQHLPIKATAIVCPTADLASGLCGGLGEDKIFRYLDLGFDSAEHDEL